MDVRRGKVAFDEDAFFLYKIAYCLAVIGRRLVNIHAPLTIHFQRVRYPKLDLKQFDYKYSRKKFGQKKIPAPRYSPTLYCVVPSPQRPLTAVFGMGTGVTFSLWAPGKSLGTCPVRDATLRTGTDSLKYINKKNRFATLSRVFYSFSQTPIKSHRRMEKR